MFARAKADFDARRIVVENFDELVPTLDKKCVAILPWCETPDCEDEIKDRTAAMCVVSAFSPPSPCLHLLTSISYSYSAKAASQEAEDSRAPSAGAKTLCIPYDQTKYPSIEGKTCPGCGKPSKRWTMFGRSAS